MPPPKKKTEKYFSGKYYVKFGHFVNFSYIFSGNRNEMPVSGGIIPGPTTSVAVLVSL